MAFLCFPHGIRASTAAVVLLLVLHAAPLAGQTRERSPGDATFGVYGMAGQGFHQELARGQGFSEFGTVAVAGSRLLSRRLGLQLDLHPIILIRQPRVPPHGARETVEAFAAGIGLRWWPAPSSWRFAPFFEALAGPFYAVRPVPTTGTRFNFFAKIGPGVLLPWGEKWHPEVFGRWVHISNAGIGRANPDWDYWAIGVGARLDVPSRR